MDEGNCDRWAEGEVMCNCGSVQQHSESTRELEYGMPRMQDGDLIRLQVGFITALTKVRHRSW